MWFRCDDKLDSNTKFRRVRRSHPTKRKDASAAGVWLQAATWSAGERMDGFCPEEIVETFDDDWQDITRRLEEATGPSGEGLFVRGEVNGEPGWFVHDFLEHNDSAEKQAADAHAGRVRKELYSDPDLVNAIKKRDKDRCRYCGTKVKWNDRRSMGGGTFDHVKPVGAGGNNTLDNVVVACRRCNSKKGKRTLREAGMRLLTPGSLGAPTIDEPGTSSDGVAARVGSGRGQVGNQIGTSSTDRRSTAAELAERLRLEAERGNA